MTSKVRYSVMLAAFALVLVILGVLYVTLRHTESDEEVKVENLYSGCLLPDREVS